MRSGQPSTQSFSSRSSLDFEQKFRDINDVMTFRAKRREREANAWLLKAGIRLELRTNSDFTYGFTSSHFFFILTLFLSLAFFHII